MGRTDAPAELICHGTLSGPVPLYGADAVDGEATVTMEGVGVALLGTADGGTLTRWFEGLSDGGTVLAPPCRCGPGTTSTGRSATATASGGSSATRRVPRTPERHRCPVCLVDGAHARVARPPSLCVRARVRANERAPRLRTPARPPA